MGIPWVYHIFTTAFLATIHGPASNKCMARNHWPQVSHALMAALNATVLGTCGSEWIEKR